MAVETDLSSFLSCCLAKSRSLTRLRSSSMQRLRSTAPKLMSCRVSYSRTSLISRSRAESVVKLGEWFTCNTISFLFNNAISCFEQKNVRSQLIRGKIAENCCRRQMSYFKAKMHRITALPQTP